MNYENKRKLVKNIIENEFNHVQSSREGVFAETNLEQEQLNKTSTDILNKLRDSLSKEQEVLLMDLEEAISDEWINLCRFYFEEGVRAGLVNLEFLKDIKCIGSYIG